MCIACELGYWTMIDALEAERKALQERESTASAEPQFACEPAGEPAVPDQPLQAPQTARAVDESTP